MIPSTGFFNKNIRPEPQYINIGERLFSAVSVLLIEHFKYASRINEHSLKTILELFNRYFPQYISSQHYLTPIERIRMLINNTRTAELVDCLSFILRQLTIDTIYSLPTDFPNAFDNLTEDTDKNYLRDPNTPMPDCALRALSKIIGCTIYLIHKEPGKEIGKKEVFNKAASIEFSILKQHNMYFPKVLNPEDFVYVGKLPINPTKQIHFDDTGSLKDIFTELKALKLSYQNSYEKQKKIMKSMIAAEDTTEAELYETYIKCIEPEVDSNSKKEYAQFLLDLENKNLTNENIGQFQKDYTLNALIHSLSSLISTDQIDADVVFDNLTRNSSPISGVSA